MQYLATIGQGNRPRPLHRLLDFVATYLSWTRPQTDAARAIDPAHVRSADAHDGVLHGRAGHVFGSFYCLLNGGDRLVQFVDQDLARAGRFRHPLTAITPADAGNL